MSWIDLFKVGTHTDSAGNTQSWNESDLKQIVEKYNNQPAEERHKAPAIAGLHHENENLAAYGWVKQLRFEGGHLWGEFEDVEPQFAKMVNDGRFGTVSIALYPNLVLRHVAFLGAVPPAIKGLKTPKFSEDKTTIRLTYQIKKQIKQFNESQKMTIEEFITQAVEAMKASDGDEVANNLRGVLEKLKDSVLMPKKDEAPKEGEPKFSESPEQKRIAELERKINSQEDEKFFSECMREGRLLPKQKKEVELLLEATRDTDKPLQFSEKETLSAQELLKRFIKGLHPVIEFSEVATLDRAGESNGSFENIDKLIEARRKGKQ